MVIESYDINSGSKDMYHFGLLQIARIYIDNL